jgi:uncharacterized protein (TIGR02270 family)
MILWDVVEEHLDEAEFLFSQWEGALLSPSWSLAEIDTRLEARLFAQIDGLVTAGQPAEARLLLPALSAEEPSRVTASALTLLSGEGSRGIQAVFAALPGAASEAEGARLSALVRALGLAPRDDLGALLLTELGAETATAQAAVLAALAFRGVDPGRSLSKIGAADPLPLQIAGARAARVSRTRSLHELAAALIGSKDPVAREEAILTGLILGFPPAWAMCRKLGASGDPKAAGLLPLLAMGGDTRDQQALLDTLSAPGLRAAAIEALGYGGRASGAEACLPLLGDKEMGRLAGEAFWAITGVPREGVFLAAEEEEKDALIPLSEEQLSVRAVPGPDAALPMLSAKQVEAWWGKHRSRFDRQTRYLYGEPMRAGAVLSALERGPMRRRHALSMELAIRSRGQLRIETRAFTQRQWGEITRLGAPNQVGGDLEGIEFSRPFS